MEVNHYFRIACTTAGLLAAIVLPAPLNGQSAFPGYQPSSFSGQNTGSPQLNRNAQFQPASKVFQPSSINPASYNSPAPENPAATSAGGLAVPPTNGFNPRSTFPSSAKNIERNQNQSPFPGQTTDRIQWIDGKELERARQLSVQLNKPLLLHFWNERCPPCLALEKNVFPSPQMAQAINSQFVAVKVNTLETPQIHKYYGVTQWPWDVFLAPDGSKLIDRGSPRTVEQYVQHLNSTANLQRNFTRFAAMTGNPTANAKTAPASASPATKPPFTVSNPAVSNPGATPPASPSKAFSPATSSAGRTSPNTQFSPDSSPMEVAKSPSTTPARTPEVAFSPNPNNGNAVQTSPTGPGPGAAPKQAPEPMSAGGQFNSKSTQIRNQFFNSTSQTAATSNQAAPPARNSAAIGLGGKCPVALLLEEKWITGSKDWGCVHRGKTYLFKDKAYRDIFMKDPDRYAPVLAGFDVVAFRETGQLIEGKNSIGAYGGTKDDRRIYRFASEENKNKFKADSQRYNEAVRMAMQNADGRRFR